MKGQAPGQLRLTDAPPPPEAPRPLTVGELTDRIKGLLEGTFPAVFVEGEISNLTKHASGHWYFTLKDEQAQISSVMFKFTNQKVRFKPEPGMKVLAWGEISVYAPRGNYQLKLTRMEPAGLGALQLAFEQLKKRLEAEGLFDQARKRPLPFLPRRIGIVTSPTGAAIRDIITVATRRFPTIELILCPVKVQGEGSAEEVAQGIERLNRLGGLDVLIVGRGGGSLEDLWAFNEERVARAIHASRTPVVSAVGHEVDFTIADFVADLRAATPSAAAELVVPERAALLTELQTLRGRLASGLTAALARVKEAFVAGLLRRLHRRPRELVELAGQRLDDQVDRLLRAMRHGLELKRRDVQGLTDRVAALNPLETFRRGFGIPRLPGGRVVRSVAEVQAGASLDVRLIDGTLHCTVTGTTREETGGPREG